ncbi:MAG: nucleoside diphosphate kinase regulator [Phenylobacterium sp.]|uniref:nucleoside diphosphate kinase regulator n=1 Tax=Phenylobacterium sp. TaxID=1871053 RepID=UPI0027362265|nr:nucleoside diphosphate kinase regulator [Phenylobacterium sp.]MDP3173342.1 nucleoside diphosphate kinase regulator [Phenylobacterium sp.]
MARQAKSNKRPPIVLRETDAERLSNLASQMEANAPLAAGLLLDEIERADIRADHLVGDSIIGMHSVVEFVDGAHDLKQTVTLVYPTEADISEGRISILTPVGAGLIGLTAGQSISWPARDGRERILQILKVSRAAAS